MQRLPFVDWTRGLAVVAMVLWHSGDAWLRAGLKAGDGFAFLRFFGGLAAPSFLLLAGLGAALAAKPEDDPRRANRKLRDGLGRGLEIVVFGYALRLQSWLIDADAARKLYTLRAWLPIALGYALLVMAARRLGPQTRRAGALAAVGLCLVALGMWQVESTAPGRLARLLQVDVLQAIGASLVVLAAAERTLRAYDHPVGLLAAGCLVACTSHLVWSLLPGVLPVPLAAFLGRFEVAPTAPAPALFPLFPWLSYALIGAALGRFYRRAGDRLEPAVLLTTALGALLAAFTSESHAALQALVGWAPWTMPPLRVAFRVGVVGTLLGLGFAFQTGAFARVLGDFGRASLRVYWVHMLFAYGALGTPVRARLGYGAWAVLASLLLLAMWALSRARLPRQPAKPIVRA